MKKNHGRNGYNRQADSSPFRLVSDFEPAGDQPKAIKSLVQGLRAGLRHQVLLGVTGSGKTYTIANVIAQVGRPTLVLSHNKILAAQLYGEFKSFFPENAVEYFVSYYDYYQPEAYIPTTDTYIEKDSSINEEIDKMRHAATRAVLTRRDCIIVASVSAIYGIGSPEAYLSLRASVEDGLEMSRETLIENLIAMQYVRNDVDFHRGTFRVRGDTIDIFPAYESERAIRISFFDDTVEQIVEIDPLRSIVLRRLRRADIFPGSHYVAERGTFERAIRGIRAELGARLAELRSQGHELFAQRLEQRTNYDLEMLEELGYCSGIENYARYLDGRKPGEPPYTLLTYFPRDFLLVIDESHMSIPQLGAMFMGDRSRKDKLVEYGFRLPSARDNRPLNFEEFEERVNQVIYVSATPAAYELTKSEGRIVEQVVRPTGLPDPEVEVRPTENQVDDLLNEIQTCAQKGERVLVTVLTKRFAEELTAYYQKSGVRVRYMHADVETLERIELVRQLRQGIYDVLIGINLLREGLDLPEVSLVAILDADKEGYLRSETSLIQTCGRAARNINGRVIMYADTPTRSMERAIKEMNRRRRKQLAYNKKHSITARSVEKKVQDILETLCDADYLRIDKAAEDPEIYMPDEDFERTIAELRQKMLDASASLNFEEAAIYRDRLLALERRKLELGL